MDGDRLRPARCDTERGAPQPARIDLDAGIVDDEQVTPLLGAAFTHRNFGIVHGSGRRRHAIEDFAQHAGGSDTIGGKSPVSVIVLGRTWVFLELVERQTQRLESLH